MTAERISRVFRPLRPGHWAIATKCAVCQARLVEGDTTALVACATTSDDLSDPPPRTASVRALVAHASCTHGGPSS